MRFANSAIIAEACLESAAGLQDAALDGAKRKIHLFGDFVVFVSGHVHREGNAVFVGEFVDGGGDFLGAEGAFGRFEARVLRQVQMIEVVGGVDDGGGTAGTAVVVDEDVAHDGEHPAFEVGVVGVLVFVVEHLERCVLKQVVCVITVGGKHICEVEHVVLHSHQIVLKFSRSHD